jgi:nicotinamidase-related amidase
MTTEAIEPINPSRAALVVMDYQNGIIGMVENGDELVAITRNLIRTFREHGGTVAYVRVAFADEDFVGVPETSGMLAMVPEERRAMFRADAPTTQIHESLTPQEGDIVVRKKRVGAFSTTDLHEQLQARGIDTLVLAGISTGGCVHSTVLDAFDRDYRIIVVKDACADRELEVHNFLFDHVFNKRGTVVEVRELHGLLH